MLHQTVQFRTTHLVIVPISFSEHERERTSEGGGERGKGERGRERERKGGGRERERGNREGGRKRIVRNAVKACSNMPNFCKPKYNEHTLAKHGWHS